MPPRPNDSTAAGETKAAARETKAPAAEPARPPIKTIKAEPGQPWPDPPHGGHWERDPVTGDLHLVGEFAEPDEKEVARRRAARQAEAVRDRERATNNTAKE